VGHDGGEGPQPALAPDRGCRYGAARRGIAIADACLARAGVVCQACGDACPERAIGFPLRRGGPPLPVVEEDRCTGCGACVAICPVGAVGLPEGRR
jgi:ferredoxin-type protein NapF